jgi:hypothetical protein
MSKLARSWRRSTLRRWLKRLSPVALLRRLRWASVRRLPYALTRRYRLWRLARLPRMPLDDDLFELAAAVAGRTDDILSSIRRSADPEVRKWFRSIEPKIRELAQTAFRLVGTAQELRTALERIGSGADPARVLQSLRQDLAAETDPELQRFVAQTLRSEQRKSESLEQSRRNLRLIGVRLGAITSFLDSVYLRVPNVKVLADRPEWFAEVASGLDSELRGLEETFEEFRQAPLPVLEPERPKLSGWTVDLRSQRK